MMKKMKINKGITLIALVITIVILLILAGISINLTLGDNGIITRTIRARDEKTIAEEKDAVALAYGACEVVSKGKPFSAEELKQELENTGNDVEVERYGYTMSITFNKTGHNYNIDTNGNMKDKEDVAKSTIIDGGTTVGGTTGDLIYAITLDGKLRVEEAKGTDAEYQFDLENSTIIDDDATNIKTIIGDTYLKNDGKIYFISNPRVCLSDIAESLKDRFITEIQSKNGSVYAMDNEGRIYGWGYNGYGQLGNGTTTNVNEDAPICISDVQGSALNNVKIKSTYYGSYNVLVIDENNKLYVWGANYYGKLGNGSTNDILSPVCLTDTETSPLYNVPIKEVAYSGYNTFVITTNQDVYSWGYNWQYGELGAMTTEKYNPTPRCITNISTSKLYQKKIKKICKHWTYGGTYAIDNDGVVYGWGENTDGQLGDGTTTWAALDTQRIEPEILSNVEGSDLSGKNIEDIFIFDYGNIILAIDQDKKIYSWGYNFLGQLGNGLELNGIYKPICISNQANSPLNETKICKLIEENSSIIAIGENKKIYVWGADTYLGIREDYEYSNIPICLSDVEGSVLNGKKITDVYLLDYNMYAIDEDGLTYTWGSDSQTPIYTPKVKYFGRYDSTKITIDALSGELKYYINTNIIL